MSDAVLQLVDVDKADSNPAFPQLYSDETATIDRWGVDWHRIPTLAWLAEQAEWHQQVHDGLPWIVGDLYQKAAETEGELAPGIFAAFEPETLMRYGRLAQAVPRERRQLFDLPASFFQVVTTAALTRDEQDELLTTAVAEDQSQADLRKAKRKKLREKAKAAAGELPEGVYDVIVADPPWPYDFAETESTNIEDSQYPAMDIEDIKALELPVADDAVLILWATNPKLREAFAVMDAWGFEYKTNWCWDKQRPGLGYWSLGQHELLLIGTRGKFSPPETMYRFSSVINADRKAHSEKPDELYDRVEQMFSGAERLELFARHPREGWTVWGSDAEPV